MSDDKTPLEAFKSHASSASFHFADDTASGEWRLGFLEQDKAIALFDQHPELHKEMREAAQEELWAHDFNRLRPENDPTT